MMTALAATAVIVILVVALGHRMGGLREEAEVAHRRQRESDRARQRSQRALKKLAFERDEIQNSHDVLAEALDDAETRALASEGRYLVVSERLVEAEAQVSDMSTRLSVLEKDPNYKYGCTKRGAFRLKEDAELFAAHLAKKEGEAMQVYACPQCREFFTGNPIWHAAHETPYSVRKTRAQAVGLDSRNLAVLRAKMEDSPESTSA